MRPSPAAPNTSLESVCPGFNPENLELARKKSWDALQVISTTIRPGLNEVEAVGLVNKLLSQSGADKSWHKPIVRFGAGTARPYTAPSDPNLILQDNDIFFIDIGPVWQESDGIAYEGDVGDSYALGTNNDFLVCAQTARELHALASNFWRSNNPTGAELYQWLSQQAIGRGYEVVPEDDGHRIGDFPHKRFCSTGLWDANHKMQPNLWVLEVHIRDKSHRFGGFFEDILR